MNFYVRRSDKQTELLRELSKTAVSAVSGAGGDLAELLPGTLGFATHTLVGTRLNTSAFEQKYRGDEMGRRAYDPKILLKMVLLGYARGLISSRKL